MALVAAVLAVAALAVIVLMRMSDDGHVTRGEGAAGAAEGQMAHPAGDAAGPGRTNRVTAPAPPPTTENSGKTPVPRTRKLIYRDGSPAAGVELRRAAGRPVVTKIFRNGDYPQKRIWLITKMEVTRTAEDGSFRFPALGQPAVLYTDAETPAFLLEEYDEGLTEYIATRRVEVTGVLRDADGALAKRVWLSAQQGWPEDYDTRNAKEHDSFVNAMGDLEIDPFGKWGVETDFDGCFTLELLPGRNIVSFGEWREGGSAGIEAPPTGPYDLGDFAMPAKPAAASVARTLAGKVLNLAGAAQPNMVVRLWDGNVGEPSHETHTNEDGDWRVAGLTGSRVIAWAVSPTQLPHVVLPCQSSGTIQMPCNTPIVLRAPALDEYCWVSSPSVNGFFLFIRDGVFLGGDFLSHGDRVGLPPGGYHVFVVSQDGIRETRPTINKGGERKLVKFTRS